MVESSSSLVVRGESVQSLYSQFRSGKLLVNRRYQRKLVWNEDEKRAFIDSLMREMPVPLILVAEIIEDGKERLEVIDGLQRLNAVFSYIENYFGVEGGGFFDLNALAETKELLDNGELIQKGPVLSRSDSVDFSGYTIPISVYRTDSNEKVDEVFRRINANGRHLSRQDIRQAGALSMYAQTVRSISASIRGDFSVVDLMDLKAMPSISISSNADGPGVYVGDIFWVRHRILEREQVRTSRDEEIVGDLVASMVLNPVPAYDSRVLDELYGLIDGSDDRAQAIDVAIRTSSLEELQSRFDDVISAFEEVFDGDHPFSVHFFSESKQRVPRYFESVFLALDEIVNREGLSCLDIDAIRSSLKDFGTNHLNIPSGGGTWTGKSKRDNIGVVSGAIRQHAVRGQISTSPFALKNSLRVKRLLKASTIEVSLLEMKQGLSVLSDVPKLSGETVTEIAKSVVAIANSGKGQEGYVLIGVADKEADAKRVEALSGSSCPVIENRWITGVSLDAEQVGGVDKLVLWFSDKFKSCGVDSELEGQVLRDLRVTQLAERSVIILPVKDIGRPATIRKEFYERHTSQTLLVEGSEIGRLYQRFA